ncbi:hypothetical protein DHEL01_v212248 [Diaporthe helianthi]|uniref:Uncharacterized protein n=1 Tax=Diaporthe helianthi TaxID=158607 RepID=A0A2P5HGH8_DIAHE|nr:hypothetical protein DHEL01_v212248 [Diaporthe helianthi]
MHANVLQVAPQVGTVIAPSDNPQAPPQTGTCHFFKLSPELRHIIYRDVLITPFPGVVRSFVPPAFLQTNKVVRSEALALYYTDNHFEITVKRAPQHQNLDPKKKMVKVDSYAWHRFFTMWGEFSSTGSDVLRYITRITLIYQLSMDTGFGFGEDIFDNRLGFRFYGGTCEGDMDVCYGEAGSEIDCNDSEEDRELDVQNINDPEDDLVELNDEPNDNVVAFIPSNAPPPPDYDPVGVFKLAMGDFNWPSRRDTHFFLYERVNVYQPNELWDVYPIHRLTDLLWRCAKDCPLAARNVDFLCEDYLHWMTGDEPYTEYDPRHFYTPEDEE